MRSITVDGMPGQLAAVDLAPQASRISAGHLVEPSRVGPAVAVRARRGDGADLRRAPAPGAVELRHADADRARLAPVSQRKRRAGFGRTSVYGPGRTARAIAAGAAAQLGHALEEHVEVGASSADGCRLGAALQPVEARDRLLAVRRRAEPVHRVRRQDDRLARRGSLLRLRRRLPSPLHDALPPGQIA